MLGWIVNRGSFDSAATIPQISNEQFKDSKHSLLRKGQELILSLFSSSVIGTLKKFPPIERAGLQLTLDKLLG
ncbi:hypothetical protein AYI68_g5206 [Smittium mucronatum]|uniref:Uncharacterized protein n=1 Tax=Smittium mucronatum TaxID=133383 RepID=A0A1R0GUZ7_9FUNG|nr:hypothetical protein AYI68_g5206 [Smittium mucronatum]